MNGVALLLVAAVGAEGYWHSAPPVRTVNGPVRPIDGPARLVIGDCILDGPTIHMDSHLVEQGSTADGRDCYVVTTDKTEDGR